MNQEKAMPGHKQSPPDSFSKCNTQTTRVSPGDISNARLTSLIATRQQKTGFVSSPFDVGLSSVTQSTALVIAQTPNPFSPLPVITADLSQSLPVVYGFTSAGSAIMHSYDQVMDCLV